MKKDPGDAIAQESEFWEYVRKQATEIATRAHCELCEMESGPCRSKMLATAERIRSLVLEATDRTLPVIEA